MKNLKYAISNIAWKPHENEAMYNLIKQHDFIGLEIAPSIFLNGSKTPYGESTTKCIQAKKEAEKHGLRLISMQALLFGSSGLILFENENLRRALFDYCLRAIDFAFLLKIPNLVFGSPKNRIIPKTLNSKEAQKIAIEFFEALGDYAYRKNTCVAMEANARAYGGNFITTTIQAIDLVKRVNSKGFRLNLDMGTMSLENEDPEIINEALQYVNHIHISEGYLSPISEGNDKIHKERAKIINESNYDGWLSIEMKALSECNNLDHVKKSLDFVNHIYK